MSKTVTHMSKLIKTSCVGCVLVSCVIRADAYQVADELKDNKAQEIYEELFAEKVAKAQLTREIEDDLEIAITMLNAAVEANEDKALVKLLCERVFEVMSRHPEHHHLGHKALRFLASIEPGEKLGVYQKRSQLHYKTFIQTPVNDRKPIARKLIDLDWRYLSALIDAGEEELVQTISRRIISIANAAKLKEREKIAAEIERFIKNQSTLSKIAELKKTLKDDPFNSKVREELIRLYVLELRDISKANLYVDPLGSVDKLQNLLPLMVADIQTLSTDNLQAIAEWYQETANSASKDNKTYCLTEANRYYTQFLKKYARNDSIRLQIAVKLKSLEDELKALGVESVSSEPRNELLKPDATGWLHLWNLVNPQTHGQGTWTVNQSTFILSNGAGSLTLPVSISGGYQLQLSLSQTVDGGPVNVLFPVGRTVGAFFIGTADDPNAYGLSRVKGHANQQFLKTQSTPLLSETMQVFDLTVKPLGGEQVSIIIKRGSETLIDWKGNESDLFQLGPLDQFHRRAVVIQCDGSSVNVSEMKVQADAKSELRLIKDIHQGNWIQYLSEINLADDVVFGKWVATPEGKYQPVSKVPAQLKVPIVLPEDYEWVVNITPAEQSDLFLTIPVDDKNNTQAVVTHAGSTVEHHLALNNYSRVFYEAKNATDAAALKPNQPNIVKIRVRQYEEEVHVEAWLNGRYFVDHRGKRELLSSHPSWSIEGKPGPMIGVSGGGLLVNSTMAKALTGEVKLEHESGPDEKNQPVPELKADATGWYHLDSLVAEKQHSTGGQLKVGQNLSLAGKTCGVIFPVEIKGDYEFKVTFEKSQLDRQNPVDLTLITLPVGSTRATVVIGGLKTGNSGISNIGGNNYEHNRARSRGGILGNGKRYTITCKVKVADDTAAIQALLGRRVLVSWQGKISSLSYYGTPSSNKYPAGIGFGGTNTQMRIYDTKVKINKGEIKRR